MNNRPMLNAYPDSMGGKLSDEITDALKKEVVRKQIEMIRFRNTCRAFEEGAKISIEEEDGILRITWSKAGFSAELTEDFINGGYEIKEN